MSMGMGDPSPRLTNCLEQRGLLSICSDYTVASSLTENIDLFIDGERNEHYEYQNIYSKMWKCILQNGSKI